MPSTVNLPIFIRPQRPDASALTDARVKNLLVEILISNHEKFFPGFHFHPIAPLYFNPPSSNNNNNNQASFNASSAMSTANSSLMSSASSISLSKYASIDSASFYTSESESSTRRSSESLFSTPKSTGKRFNSPDSPSSGKPFGLGLDSAGSSDSLDDILEDEKLHGSVGLATAPPPKQSPPLRSGRPDRGSLRMKPPPPPVNRAKSPSASRPPTLPIKTTKAPNPPVLTIISPPEDATIVITRTTIGKIVEDGVDEDYEEIADPAEELKVVLALDLNAINCRGRKAKTVLARF